MINARESRTRNQSNVTLHAESIDVSVSYNEQACIGDSISVSQVGEQEAIYVRYSNLFVGMKIESQNGNQSLLFLQVYDTENKRKYTII